MKKLCFILAAVITLSAVIPVFPADQAEGVLPFKDVKAGKWYTEAVTYVYEHGIMTGMTADTFSVSTATTRAQLVTILSRLDRADVSGMKSENRFTDVNNKKWYADAVGWASSLGLVNGYGDGTFRPDAPVLRQELCAMLARFAAHQGMVYDERPIIDTFADSGRIPKWAGESVESMRLAGIVGGNERGEFSPAATATRAEIATMIMRYLGNDPMYDRMENILNYVAGESGMAYLSLPFRDRVIGSGTTTSITNQFLPQMGLSADTYVILFDESKRESIVRDTDVSITGDEPYNNDGQQKTDNMGVAKLAIKNLVTGEETPYKTVRLLVKRYLGEENIDPDDWEPGMPEGALEAMLDASVYSTGDLGRFAKFFRKAEAGEPVTVAFMGGSITARASAGDVHCFAKQTFNRIQKMYPQSDMTYVNAGIGGTGSDYGEIRLDSNVLVHRPDLFVIEFAVNDNPDARHREAFETIVRRVMAMDNDPAVMILFVGVAQDGNCTFMKQVADRYGLPVADCRAAADLGLANGWMYTIELNYDGAHPREWFHSFMALSLVNEIDLILKRIESASEDELAVKPLPERLTEAVYEDLTAILPGRDAPDASDGFTVVSGLFKYDKGWQATDGSAELRFNFHAKNIFVTTEANEGFVIEIDGVSQVCDEYGDAIQVLSAGEAADHTVVIRPVGNGSLASVTGVLYN